MKTAERIIMLALALALIGLAALLYIGVTNEQSRLRDAVAAGAFERPHTAAVPTSTTSTSSSEQDWRTLYPNTVSMTIDGVPVEASLADSLPERIKGLSDTPYLPENVVKLFAFGVPGAHSIWMKNMNYPLDIMWVAQDGAIVHIVKNVSPNTYPNSFASPVPAWFVVEAKAGFLTTHDIGVGDEVVLPLSPEASAEPAAAAAPATARQ